ncbi:N-acetylmuramoyl-L-alanine amidase [Bacillus albus]|uniref:N-acetylmuramoyl-L-alanine amidase n=2 Tax=Bacillus TaxID=1386 RepID=UPI001C1035C5|nr:N-acetylmuramoyl-L-alanine amidase [Bacillus albus]MBU5220707.1 N-acetylmuramoyl-L-alanine amidase [Bacillus albus]
MKGKRFCKIISMLGAISLITISTFNPITLAEEKIELNDNSVNKKFQRAETDSLNQDSNKVVTPMKEWLLPEDNSKERTKSITHVLIHFMSNAVAKPQNPYNVKDAYNSFLDNGLSAHYLIDRTGFVYQFVNENRVAYHAGKGSILNQPKYTNKLNEYSIGIELLGIGTWEEMLIMMAEETYNLISPHNIGYTDAQYKSLKLLLDDICKRNPSIQKDRNHILGHDEYAKDRKTDPGSLFDWNKISLK